MSLARRLGLAFALLLGAFGLIVAGLARELITQQEQETLQRMSRGLATNIVEHWPVVTHADGSNAERAALQEVLSMLMVVNPAIEVYVLDGTGRVRAFAGEADAVRRPQVALQPLMEFMEGAALPLLSSDPKGGSAGKLFSAARLPAQAGQGPGYLYVVLDGEKRQAAGADIGQHQAWKTTGALAAAGLLATLTLGGLVFASLTRPLRRLAARMVAFGAEAPAPPDSAGLLPSDEVRAIEQAFDTMAERIARQRRERAEQEDAHREAIAAVAHDLRTPLTALHGHLEAAARHDQHAAMHHHHLATALAQSDKVRRLSQQLFELASLQTGALPLQLEPVHLGELLTDAVQKFVLTPQAPAVTLAGAEPVTQTLRGDAQLLERALTNLIDNALRHAASERPVRVWLEHAGHEVQVMVEDHGPGLPRDIEDGLSRSQPLHQLRLWRPGGGIGGLGLAIAQRIAWLHGGTLKALRSGGEGTLLCLALPAGGPGG